MLKLINFTYFPNKYFISRMLRRILFFCSIVIAVSISLDAGGDFEEPNPSISRLQPDPQLQHWILQHGHNLLGDDHVSQYLLEELELMKIQAPAMYKYHESNHAMYLDMANEGHQDVMCLLGANFHFGRGVVVNPVKALRWFIHSAEKGNLQAQLTTGLYFYNGIGLQKDTEQAFYWLHKAMAQGNELAKSILNKLNPKKLNLESSGEYSEKADDSQISKELIINALTDQSEVVEVNREISLDDNFRDQGLHNDSDQETSLHSDIDTKQLVPKNLNELLQQADDYFTGNGVTQDAEKAMELYEKAAEQNSVEAQLKLGLILIESMTGIDGQETKGLSFLQNAAANGSLEAQKIYAEELLKMRQVKTAAFYLEMAAQQGDVDSMMSLAELSSEQSSTLHNIDSVYWYLQAALKGHHEAQYKSGMLYVEGQTIPQDFRLAYRWLLLAGQKGHKEAQFQLGVLYSKGLGVPRNDYRAAKWYKKSAQQGHRDASAILGTLYYDGKGVSQDFEQALHWFTQAAQSGDLQIQELLIKLYKGQMQIPPDYVQAYAWANILAQNHDSHRQEADYLQTYLSNDELKDAQELSLNYYAAIQKNRLTAR